METTQQNSRFRVSAKFRKGEFGEGLVDKFLLSRGCIPYIPIADAAHPFDRLCATRNKHRIFVAEVKSKARRTYYPDTGIDVRHYEGYRQVREKHRLDVFLFFVDEHLKKIYGGWLHDLELPRTIDVRGNSTNYPLTHSGIIYFPLVAMQDICEFGDDSALLLRDLSERNYTY